MNDDLVVMAVTGGFATGKSTVAKIIADSGYSVINTDEIAKDLMNSNQALREDLIREFGKESFLADGTVNSAFLADMVFSDDKKSDSRLQSLNKIVHPFVIDEMIFQIEKLGEEGHKLIFVESALIFEAELDEGFDYIVVVACSSENQIKRAMAKHNLSKEKVMSRIAKQISLDEKVKNADFVINNDLKKADLINTVNFLLPIFVSLKPKDDNDEDDM